MQRNAGNRHPDSLKGAIFAAGFAMLPTLASAAVPEPKVFRDWMAGCDNVKTCTAVSLPAEAADPIAYLRLERPAGSDGAASLRLKLRGDWKTPPRTAQLKLDGAAFPAGGKPLAVTTEADLATLTFSAEDTAALIEAARKAAKLTVTTSGLTGSVSLAGSIAAMLWIDEQQGRLGTTTALIRKGTNTAVPPAPALPVVAAVPAPPMLDMKTGKRQAASLRAELKKKDPDSCEDDTALAGHDEAWALGNKRVLVALSCSRGAYNLSSSFYIMPENEPAKAVPLSFADGRNELTNASFDPRTGHIAFSDKGRGMGDCGATGGYAWTGSGFVQSEFSLMGECRGISPEDWITLYRSANR
ncbi:hypothetical protein BTHI11S_00484 [Bosea thiooxidans]|uniref:DUF1176 domain-containing protein n=2 Tax=Bosea thiooxidans TaxID=53254 RepID=A0A1T5AU99_9HYPH|nr:DUF1176 domain-containing protein [Bosea thiooxidans]SKB38505.1 Protein of unknown function [Bosea thiooxidans]